MQAIKQNSSGDDVTNLQNRLTQLGFSLDVDGKFGPQTAAAVREFQTMFGYTVDGIVGSGTSALIDQQIGYGWNAQDPEARLKAYNSQSDAAKELNGNLRKGSDGQDVRFLQNRLAILGFDVAVDGDFGSGTDAAVRELQTLFGYTVDGIVGPGTNNLINQQIGYSWNRKAPDAVEKAQASQG